MKTFWLLKYSASPESPCESARKDPKTKIKTGLDLSGGSKALVKAKDRDLSSEELSDLISVTSNRINVYGISDIQIFVAGRDCFGK